MHRLTLIDLEDLIKDVFDIGTDCKGMGYHELNNGVSVEISTASTSGYSVSDLCDFSFYAPNAAGIKVEALKFKVRIFTIKVIQNIKLKFRLMKRMVLMSMHRPKIMDTKLPIGLEIWRHSLKLSGLDI